MPLRAHLVELRNRLIVAGVFVILFAIGGWFVYQPLISELVRPMQVASEANDMALQLRFASPTEAFDWRIKLSIWIGLIASSPVWIYQLWAFITPGLTRKERGYALGFFFVSVPLFLSGGYLAYRAMPNFVRFLVSFSPQGFSNFIDAQVYLGFVMRLILTFGLSFLVPVVLVGVNFIGLMSGRTMLKGWRWVVVASFGFAAVATPTPDVMSMFLLALPLLALFFVAIGIALLNDRRRRRKDPDLAATDHYGDLADDEASPL